MKMGISVPTVSCPLPRVAAKATTPQPAMKTKEIAEAARYRFRFAAKEPPGTVSDSQPKNLQSDRKTAEPSFEKKVRAENDTPE